MVVLEDGLVKRSDYRRFKVKTVKGNDDYAAMEEVLTRSLPWPSRAPAPHVRCPDPTDGAAAPDPEPTSPARRPPPGPAGSPTAPT